MGHYNTAGTILQVEIGTKPITRIIVCGSLQNNSPF